MTSFLVEAIILWIEFSCSHKKSVQKRFIYRLSGDDIDAHNLTSQGIFISNSVESINA